MRKIIIALAVALFAATTVSAVSMPTGGKFKNLAQNNNKKLAEAQAREEKVASKLSFSQLNDELSFEGANQLDVQSLLDNETVLEGKQEDFKHDFIGVQACEAPDT